MASKTTLPGFAKLNDSAYFHKAEQIHGPTNKDAPELVLILSWAGAPLHLIRKYTDTYARHPVFANSSIILCRTEFLQILGHTERSQDRPLEPVLSLLHESTRVAGKRVLVHLFSNGGSYKFVEMVKRYKAAYGTPMPIDTIIVDSAPGIPTLLRSFKALSYALPRAELIRWPLQLILLLGLIFQRSIERIWFGEGLLRKSRRQLNDPSIVDGRSKRCYIYSKEDELVEWTDVRDHALDAQSRGFSTTKAEFDGSAHVAHMRRDPVRYWEVVEETWRTATSNSRS